MADTMWNDVLYTDVMQSPGYDVDYAICTTYSLDMPTLLSVPFMMGTMSELNDAAMKSPHIVLEAISRAAGKFVVFCNAGCISVPKNDSKVYSLLEKCVVQMALPAKGKGFVNFHPKVWMIKETNRDDNSQRIKVVVMSRNLTGSNDLDVVCELTGDIGNTVVQKEKHKPLMDFLDYLEMASKGNVKKIVDGMKADISKVKRFSLEDNPMFQDYDFFPMGIEGHNGKDVYENVILKDAYEAVVISPFVDEPTLNKLKNGHRKTLITRHNSVTPDIMALFKDNDGVFAVKEVMTDRQEGDVAVDIHEKVYFIHDNNSKKNYLYLGSTNATQNGFDRNVEFLLRLTFKPSIMSYNKFRGELINDSKECMFEQVFSVPDDNGEEDDKAKDEEWKIREAISRIEKGRIERCDNDKFSITIGCRSGVEASEAKVNPLYCAGMISPLTNGVRFNDVSLVQLSEFFVLTVGDTKRVVKIECSNMPTDERDMAVYRSVIDTKSKFINYLSFMLTDDEDQFIAECSQLEHELQHNGGSANDIPLSTSLYEDMVRMAYCCPERIASIRRVMEKVDEQVLPAHFKEMYKQFEAAIKKIKRYERRG